MMWSEFLWTSLVHFVLKDACVCKLDITWGLVILSVRMSFYVLKLWDCELRLIIYHQKKKSLRSRVWIERNVICRFEFEGKGAFTKVSSVCNLYC